MDTAGDDSGAFEVNHAVRAATEAGYPALWTVFEQAEAFHREALPDVFRQPETTFPSQSLYEQLVTGPDSSLSVVDMGGDLVGFVAVREGNLPEDSLFCPWFPQKHAENSRRCLVGVYGCPGAFKQDLQLTASNLVRTGPSPSCLAAN